MAHLWAKDDQAERWAPIPLVAREYWLSAEGLVPVESLDDRAVSLHSALAIRWNNGIRDEWILLSRLTSEVQVNGSHLTLGARVLRDRDEIVLTSAASGHQSRHFFSTERLVHVEKLPPITGTTYCPRCKESIKEGELVVQCPGCGAWHHQAESLPCWSYSSRCALCDHSTEMNAGYRWTPEGL